MLCTYNHIQPHTEQDSPFVTNCTGSWCFYNSDHAVARCAAMAAGRTGLTTIMPRNVMNQWTCQVTVVLLCGFGV